MTDFQNKGQGHKKCLKIISKIAEFYDLNPAVFHKIALVKITFLFFQIALLNSPLVCICSFEHFF